MLRWDEIFEEESKVKLLLTFERKQFEATSADGYFQALVDIRLGLEDLGARIECYGSCKTVYPSPMIEAMGIAEKAYKLRLGKPALMSDLVCIFDFEPGMPLATVDEQLSIYNTWLESLG